MDPFFVLFSVLSFLAVMLGLEGLYNLWASTRSDEARRVAQRLAHLRGEAGPAEVSLERAPQRDRLPGIGRWLSGFDAGRRLQRHVRASGAKTSPGALLLLSALLALAGVALPGLMGRPAALGWALGLVLAVLPWWRIAVLRNRRVQRFEYQFPEALDLMGRAMRAGHAFPTAVKMVGDELPEQLGRDFRVLFDEMNYGVPTGEALSRLADRVPLPDVGFFVVAVAIQRESGGNLAEVLDKISWVVRERLKLMGEVRTLSAEGRLSAIILISLPFGVGLVVNLINPQFMAPLWTDPTGQRMVGMAGLLMVIGVLWMRKIIRIRV